MTSKSLQVSRSIMLMRVLEPECMDSPEEALAYDQMDHRQVNEQFVLDFVAAAGDDFTGDVLDLGTGTAQIPVALCRHHRSCRVMAVDSSIPMLELGRYNIEAAGMLGRIVLAHLDARELPFTDGQFQAVISNSIVHHLADPLEVLKHARRVTAQGGLLFFRDLMRPESEAQLEHLVQQYAADESEHAQKLFADSLRAALSVDEVRELIRKLGMPDDSVLATSDRHWTWSAIV